MELERRISAFARLGKLLNQPVPGTDNGLAPGSLLAFRNICGQVHFSNPWFTPANVSAAVHAIGQMLDESRIREWTGRYPKLQHQSKVGKKIGVIMAGNIPLVGFHDFLCVLMSGHVFLGKPSSRDDQLLKGLAEILIEIEPAFGEFIQWADSHMEGMDAVIATGSNNSGRYFEYYFSKYPHIIRKNRNSVALLSGKETMHELESLSDDILQYFGLGCRNVSKLYVPEGYIFNALFEAVERHNVLLQHNKYLNNYEYNRAIYLVNKVAHLDNGFFILKEDRSLSSPVSVVYFEYYSEIDQLILELKASKDDIQCIVSELEIPLPHVPFGISQIPSLDDYADNVDTLEFLLSLAPGKFQQPAL